MNLPSAGCMPAQWSSDMHLMMMMIMLMELYSATVIQRHCGPQWAAAVSSRSRLIHGVTIHPSIQLKRLHDCLALCLFLMPLWC